MDMVDMGDTAELELLLQYGKQIEESCWRSHEPNLNDNY